MKENTQTLYVDRIVPIHELAIIRFSYTGLLSTVQKIKTHQISSNEAIILIDSAKTDIDFAWKNYQLTYLAPEEEELVVEASDLIDQTDAKIKGLKKALGKNDPVALGKISEELHSALTPTIIKVSVLIDLQVEISKEVVEKSNGSYDSALLRFLLIINLSLLITVPLSYFIIRNVRQLVSDLHQSNSIIKNSEEKCKAFIKYAGDAIFMIDNNYLITDVNNSACNLVNYSKDELCAMNINNLMIHEDQKQFADNTEILNKEGGSIHERKFIKRDGSLVDTEVNLRVVEGIGFIGIIRDITERKQANEKIRQSEEKFHALVDHAPDAIFMVSENGIIFDVNRTACDLLQYSREELINTSVVELHPHEMRKDISAAWNALKTNGYLKDERQLLRRDKTFVEVEISRNMLPDKSGAIAIVRDITERKRMEAELTEHKEQLAMFIEHSPASLAMFDKQMKYIATSRRWINDYNLGDQDLTGKMHYDIFPEVTEEWKEIHERCLNGSIEKQEEVSFTRADGTTDWIRWEIRPWHKSSGEIGGIIMFTEVITERKKAEIKLEQSEEKNRALVENISDTIILINENQEIIYKSPSYVRTAGFNLDDHKDKNLADVIHPDDQYECLEIIRKTKESPEVPIPYQLRTLHKKGYYIWIEGTVTNLLHKESVRAFVLNHRDITERKKLEQQQQLITSIVNSSDDAIISKTVNGIITTWNHGAEKALGYAAAEVIGMPITMIVPPHLLNEEKKILRHIKNGLTVDHYETQRRRKDGELIYVSLTVSPIFDSNGFVIGASKILRDISYRKLMELEREKTTSELFKRNSDLEQFAYIVSHNLRAPLANIIGLTGFLTDEETDAEERMVLTNSLSTSVTKLDTVIRDLNIILQAKREIREKREAVHFSELLNDIQLSIADVVQKEGVSFISDFGDVDEMTTLKSYLYSIFYNLVSNSIKYKQPGISPVIEIRSSKRNNKIEITFKDNGLGIDLGAKGEQVFGLYKRFHHHVEGKGMGLFMVKTHVETLGGKVSVQSQVNTGTEFKLEFEQELI